MKKHACTLVLLYLPIALVFGQAKTRKLPGIINHPSLNLFAPYISADGNALLFVSDNGEDHALTVSYTSREQDWTEPVELPKHVNNRLFYQKGFALSADGKRMYFTSMKSPSVGGYDIMTSDLKGTTWGEPQNMMIPINSKAHEGSPSVTPDGTSIYFMRCDKMDQNKADGCSLFSSKKKSNGQWEEPVKLPGTINTGNSQAPRIMADGETIIFSSNTMSSTKGGMDLYVSRLKNGSWTDPMPLDFVNTEKDDQFVSVTALGRYLIKETMGSRKYMELVEFLIPNELRPRGVMKIEGTITDINKTVVPAYISVTDLTTGKRVYTGRPNADGSYFVYVMEGTRYEMSVDPEQSNIGYFARQFDLTTDKTPQRERANIVLKQPAAGDELPLDLVAFKPGTALLELSSDAELKRLLRVVKANPQFKYEIQVMLTGYEQDSTKITADLTEIAVDSITTRIDDIDSLGQLYKRDTIFIKTVYHNDRTQKQAQTIVDFMVKQGIDRTTFTTLVNAIPATLPENRKLVVKAVVRPR